MYEGLLELEIRTATKIALGLERPAKWPQKIKEDAEVALTVEADLKVKYFTDRTGWLAKKVQAALGKPSADAERVSGLQRAVTVPAWRHRSRRSLACSASTNSACPRSSRSAAGMSPGRIAAPPPGTHYTLRSLAEEVAEGASSLSSTAPARWGHRTQRSGSRARPRSSWT